MRNTDTRAALQLFQHMLDRLHQFGPLANQGMATFGLGGVNRARDREYITTHLQRLLGSDQRA